MAEDTATNPEAGDELLPDEGVDTGADGEVLEGEVLDPEAEPPEETEDFEFEGKVYALPKSLKLGALRQQDYTQKTQEVAAVRKALDEEVATRRAELDQQAKAQTELLDDLAEAKTIDKVLGEYRKLTQVEWNQYFAENPDQAGADWRNYELLQRQKAELDQKIDGKRKQALESQQTASAKAIEQGVAVLEKDIPGFNPAYFGELTQRAGQFGISPADMQQALADPRMMKVIHALHEAEKKLKAQETKARVQTTAAVRPAVQVRGAASPATAADPNRMSTQAWMAHRQAQLAKKGGR